MHQIIQDANKMEKNTPMKDSNLIGSNPMWLYVHNLDNVETDA